MSYVLAVAATHRVTTAAGTCQARQLAGRLPRRAWQRCSAGEGAKGHSYYDWAWIAIDPGQPGHRWLLIRGSRRSGELAFYRCYATSPSPGDRVPLTRNEIATLFGTLVIEPAQGTAHRLQWSAWRRRHQHLAGLPLPAAGPAAMKAASWLGGRSGSGCRRCRRARRW
jgi:hypothetical protein